jgi:thiamine biosynthesis lipoprotein
MAGPPDSLGDHRRLVARRALFSRAAQPSSPADHWIRVHRRILACRFEVVLPGERPEHVLAAQKALDMAMRLLDGDAETLSNGFALDRMAAQLRRAGVRQALLSAGQSSILAVGGQRAPWLVALSSPVEGERLAQLHLKHGAIGTRAAGEQFVEARGVRDGKAIHPASTWPASGTLSASVITSRAAVAEALSTAFLLGGADLAREYCGSHDGVLAIVTPESPDPAGRRPLVFGRYSGVRLARTCES